MHTIIGELFNPTMHSITAWLMHLIVEFFLCPNEHNSNIMGVMTNALFVQVVIASEY